ncbi:MAG TPA: hypothetical protein VNT30_05820, partial [Stellaceae bacterium]|nr:hypothetical protein [Stellaceae bacterium]
ERTERHLRMLQRLAEIGMELAEAVGRQALEQAKAASEPAETPRQPGPDLGLVFTRISRSVRQTVALEVRIAEGPLTPRAVSAALDKQAERAALAETDRRHRRKAQVGRIVKQAINAELSGIKAYQLERELRERLEDEDVETDIGDHPIGAIIARICWDLGLDPNWRRWAEDHWAVQEARTKAPGSPYAEWGNEEDEAEEDEAEEARLGETRPAQDGSVKESILEDPFATPEFSAILASAEDYLRSVTSDGPFGGGVMPRPLATGSDPPSG